MSARILVLGCGPAGVVASLGLQALGHDVTVIGQTRSHAVVEGISARVCQALAGSQLQCALQTVGPPAARTALWNGDSRSANTERLLYRPDFDAALLEDLRARGLPVEQARIHRVEAGDPPGVLTRSGDTERRWQADFVVDARGRAAGLGKVERVRGPETVSLACCWESDTGAAFSSVAAVESGWLWLARTQQGRLFTQFTTRADQLGVSGKSEIIALLAKQLRALPADVLPPFSLAKPSGALARSSTPILVGRALTGRYLRIGDAAMAVDPLSGNGIFQSLSSALVAPAVINTILERPADAGLAGGFYQDRLQHLFYRFARIGRDFYRSETRWQDRDFWCERSCWPDGEPAHAERDAVVGTAVLPVVNEGYIERKPVVVTADQPLGIWRVDGREILDSM